MTSTGNRIQLRREWLGLSREDLAQRLGTTRLRVWRIETGKTKLDSDELPKFAEALQTTVSELVSVPVEIKQAGTQEPAA